MTDGKALAGGIDREGVKAYYVDRLGSSTVQG